MLKPVLSRMYQVIGQQRERFYCTQGERFYLKFEIFFEVAVDRQLVWTGGEWEKFLKEASQFRFAKAMYELFSYICVSHNPINARGLYDKFTHNKTQLYDPHLDHSIGENNSLKIIQNYLMMIGHLLDEFKLPK